MSTSETKISLGKFELSLNVKDIHKSLDFYTKLGFEQVGGKIDDRWVELRQHDGELRIGLYQGHIARNCLTFFGGDVFANEKSFEAAGLEMSTKAHRESDDSDGATIDDPDGNVIYLNT